MIDQQYTMEDIREVMDHINPALLDYSEWFRAMAGFKAMGADAEMVEAWCRMDPRFKSNDVRKRWNGISDTDGVTARTVVYMASQNGYTGRLRNTHQPHKSYAPPKRKQEKAVEEPVKTIEFLPAVKGSFSDFQAEMLSRMAHKDQRRAFLEALFKPDEHINFVFGSRYDEKKEKWSPLPDQKEVYTRDQWVQGLHILEWDDYNHDAGVWVRINPTVPEPQGVLKENGERGVAVCDDDIAAFKHALIECDTIPEEDQIAAYRRLNLPIVAMVLSGGKSVHAVVRIDAKDRAEYDERVRVLHEWCRQYGVPIDTANKNPSRMVRFPGVVRGQREQKLIGLQSGAKSWGDFEYFMEGQRIGLPPLVSIDEINGANLPPLNPEVIGETLRLKDVMMVSGSSKSGKSFLLIELALAVASGGTWLGRQCTQGEVLYLNLEINDAVFSHRLENARDAMGITMEEVQENLFLLNLRGVGADMDKAREAVIHYSRQHNFSLIILDPLYKLLGGRNENDAGDVGSLFDQFDQIAEASGAAVCFVHHHSKGGQATKSSMDRASGSGVFARAPDVILDCLELEVSPDITDTLEFDGTPFGIQYEWTLRGYAPREPEQGFFVYPLHHPDKEGILRGARTAREAKAADARRQNAHRNISWQTVCDTVYGRLADASPNGTVQTEKMIGAILDVSGTSSEEFVRKKMKTCGYEIQRGKPSKGIPSLVIPDGEEAEEAEDTTESVPDPPHQAKESGWTQDDILAERYTT